MSQPTAPDLLQIAVSHHQAGRLPQAERAYRRILAAEPDHPDAQHLLGVIAHQNGQHDAAIAHIARAIQLRPGVAEYHSNLGDALTELGRLEEATQHYRVAVRLDPRHARIHNKLGIALRERGDMGAAVTWFRSATAIDPDYCVALSNLGTTLRDLGRLQDAEPPLRKVVQLAPRDAGGQNNLGNVLSDLERLEEAEACYRTALTLQPDSVDARYNLATLLLSSLRLAEGWKLFDARWHVGGLSPRSFRQPAWDGAELGGRVLFLHAEQGLGDCIQFCRYAPMVAHPDTVLEVPPALAGLIGAQGWPMRVVARGDDLPPFDVQCALMSLPGLLNIGPADIVRPAAYLRADPAKAAAWRQRLAALPGLRVGVAWAGNPNFLADRKRSIPRAMLSVFAGLAGVSLVSLQKGAPPLQDALKLHDWTDALEDFSDTAALVDGLDLVMSVDTSVAHLAGALGKPTWLLNRRDSCWRWMRGRVDSPWYPALREFRQSQYGVWDDVLLQARDAMAALAATRGKGDARR